MRIKVKRFVVLFMLAIFAVFVLAACSSDDDPVEADDYADTEDYDSVDDDYGGVSLEERGRSTETLAENPSTLSTSQLNDLALIADELQGFQVFFDPDYGIFVFNPENPNLSAWRELIEENQDSWNEIAERIEDMMSIGFFADYPTIMLSPFNLSLYWLRIENGRIVYNIVD